MTHGWAGDVLPAGIVLLGGCVQWLTGMGFALVAVPALVLLRALAGCLSTLGKGVAGLV